MLLDLVTVKYDQKNKKNIDELLHQNFYVSKDAIKALKIFTNHISGKDPII